MAKSGKNLNQIVTKTATQWKERAKRDRSNRKQISRAQKFALELMDYMDKNKITQKELAIKMNVTPQQVNKILRAKSNLTFDTLDKISAALEVEISTPKLRDIKKIRSQKVSVEMQIVHKSIGVFSNDSNSPTRTRTRRNPILNTRTQNMNEYAYTAEKI